MIKKESLLWAASIGILLIVVSNLNTWRMGKNAGYNDAVQLVTGAVLRTPNAITLQPRAFDGALSYARWNDNEPIIIGPAPVNTPGVALYTHDKHIADCFSFGERHAVTFEGFLNNTGTITPTTEWVKQFCSF